MDESVSYRVDCGGGEGEAISWTEQYVVKGARLTTEFNVSAQGETTIDVVCNEEIEMKECMSKVEATIRIETGEEGDPYYTKYEFPTSFDHFDQGEMFEYRNGQIFRNNQLQEDMVFDNRVFSGFIQMTIIVHRVEGARALPIRKEWDHLSPDCRHDKVVVLDDGTRFYVLSQILSASSSYFDQLFNNTNFVESKQEELTIGGVSQSDFQTMLEVIYPFPPDTDTLFSGHYDRMDSLLQLADRFDVPLMMDELVRWIVDQKRFFCGRRGLELMKLADKYNQLEILNKATSCLSDDKNLHEVIHENYDYFLSLPLSTREKIYHALYLQKRKDAARQERENNDEEEDDEEDDEEEDGDEWSSFWAVSASTQ